MMHTFLKWALLCYVLLLFVFINIDTRNTTAYAKNTRLLADPPVSTSTPVPTATPKPPTATPAPPTPTATPKPPTATPVPPTPTATPKPTSVPTPAPIVTQPAQTTPKPQVRPAVPTATIGPATTATGVTATPVSTAVATPTAAPRSGVRMVAPIYPPQDNALPLALALGVVAPSILISAGALWFLVKWLINRRKEANLPVDNSGQPLNSWNSMSVPR
jgi:outer membrane biosynthesis protein TonB